MAYNASQAKSPVCYNLRETNWQAYVDGLTFCFSTAAHRDKFLNECEGRKEWLSDSMSRRFHLPCDFSMLALFQLYMQIEGRGFHVVDANNGEVYESPTSVLFEVSCDGTL